MRHSPHTFASRLVMAGVDIRTVQELLGQKSTMRYAHLSPKHRTESLEKLCATATRAATKREWAQNPVAVNVQ